MLEALVTRPQVTEVTGNGWGRPLDASSSWPRCFRHLNPGLFDNLVFFARATAYPREYRMRVTRITTLVW